MKQTEPNTRSQNTSSGLTYNSKMSQLFPSEMSEGERDEWPLANRGVFAKLGRIHNVTGNYVRDIFKQRKAIRSSKAKAISKSLDREIERSRKVAA